MPGYAFLARQVLASKRLLLCGATLEVLDDLMCALTLVSQANPLHLFYFREAQPMYDFNFHAARDIEAATNPCVVLCDYDVLSQRQYIRLLADPNCIIIVMTSLPLISVPLLYKNSCTCALECFQNSCFYGNFDTRSFCHLTLNSDFTWPQVIQVVTRLQRKFRRRLQKLIFLQRFIKSWLYRPGSTYALKTIASCKQTTNTYK